jgi:hypothetical protein
MLVWCMLIIELLNDDLTTSMHRLVARFIIFEWYWSLAYNIDLMRYLVFFMHLANHGAKDGCKCALRLVSCFKGPFFTP